MAKKKEKLKMIKMKFIIFKIMIGLPSNDRVPLIMDKIILSDEMLW